MELRTQSASLIIDISIVVVVERKRALNRLAFTLAQIAKFASKKQDPMLAVWKCLFGTIALENSSAKGPQQKL